MAGFFGFFDYTKPGPGVPKDAPPKAGIVVFFEVLSRKFWNLVKLNLMFCLFNLPAILLMIPLTQYYMQNNLASGLGNIFKDQQSMVLFDLQTRFMLGSFFICIPLITVGPVQAGFTYILRNYSREEHAFLWWDFKETVKKNWKQSLVICLIDIFITALVGIDINLYANISKGGILTTMASALLTLAFVIYVMMHMYIYPMLITFKLSIKQIYKNALIFAIIKFFPNLGVLLICAVLVLASFYSPVIGFILFPLITMSLIGLIVNSYVYPKLKKYIMEKNDVQETEQPLIITEETVMMDPSKVPARAVSPGELYPPMPDLVNKDNPDPEEENLAEDLYGADDYDDTQKKGR